MAQKIILILFSLFLLSFPFGEIFRYQFGNGAAVTFNQISLGIMVFVWVIKNRSLKLIVTDKLFKPMGIFLAICLISLLLQSFNFEAQQLFISSLYILRVATYFSLYFIVKQFSPSTKRKIIRALFLVGIVVVFEGFLQYVFYQNLRNLYYLGWDDHLYRMFSVFLDPNFAGAFFVLFAIFVSGLLYWFVKTKNKIMQYVTAVVLLFTFIATYLTHSRSALIMFLVSSFIFLLYIGKKKFMFLLLGILGVLILLTSQFFYIENINLFRIASSEARLESAQNALTIFKDNPILGVGFNTYRYAQIQYKFRGGQGALVSHADAGADNSFLFVLATTGIVGFASYLYLWYKIYQQLSLRKNDYRKIESILPIIAVSSIGGIFVDSLFINSLFYPFLIEWIFILIGLSSSLKSSGSKSP